jgi:hypothetical protein
MADVIKSTSKGTIEVSRIYKSDFQKEGSLTAELKQIETTISKYPSKTVSSNLQDNIFSAEEFGYDMQTFKAERTLVAWINVPENSTPESIKERLKSLTKACLYIIVDNRPILTDSQEYGIKQGLTTLENFANKQVVRHGSDDEDGKWAKGDLVLDSLGRPQYKATFFSATEKANINKCTSDPTDFFITEEIKAEMEAVRGVVVGQAL